MSTIIGRAMVAGGGNTSTIERLEFTYTGQYNERLEDGVVELLTDGVLKFKKEVAIDAFLVGGGAAGNPGWYRTSSYYGNGGGGAGGYTKTLLNIIPRANLEYEIIIGAGGAHATEQYSDSSRTAPSNGGDTSAFGATAGGGHIGGEGHITSGQTVVNASYQYFIIGGNGGSGGGQASGRSITDSWNKSGDGGSDGGDGKPSPNGPNTSIYPIGRGQGTTTREFGEATGKLYAGGGGAGVSYQPLYGGVVGAGGDGGGGNGGQTQTSASQPGTPNTGGGGGGGYESADQGADGGSGIVCIRLHKEKEGLDFTYTGDYVKREDGVVELKSSGAITFPTEQKIDIFCVGGGGRGGTAPSSAGKGGGGGAGYTRTIKKVSAIGSYEVVVGSGSTTDSGTGGTSSFGSYSVPGGNNGANVYSSGSSGAGGSGGSGGGGAGNGGGSGGSNGNNGTSAGAEGGTGQGFTTREFGEVTGKLYAAGGGGAVNGAGGEGGGGTGGNGETSTTTGTAGEANTGSGGGGGSSYWNPGNGGSGIVCFREAQELPELAGMWTLNERLYPVNNFNQSIGCDVFINNTVTKHGITTIVGTETDLKFYKGGGIEYSLTYASQTWNINAQVTSIQFYEGATASDEFRAWLASNAIKQ